MSIDFAAVVSGLARCGSSATMQALVQGGLDPGNVAQHPYWEDGRQTTHEAEPGWLHEYVGGVIKWLDPHEWPLPDDCPPLRTVWLDRDPKQQAKSTVKYVQSKTKDLSRIKGIDVDSMGVGRSMVPERMRQLKHKRPRAIARMRQRGPVLVVKFETLVTKPRSVMERIADFLAPHELDIDTMTRVILPRSSKCSPVMLEDVLQRIGQCPTGSPQSS